MRKLISAEEFVKVWQASEDVGEVANKLEMPMKTCHTRASNYRRKGIKLKLMKRGPKKGRYFGAAGKKLDVEALNHICEGGEGV